jgi:hypothetical protein
VTAVAPAANEQAVCVTLECFDNGITALRPTRPALVEKLVEALRPRDGLAHLTLHAQSVTTGRVDALVDMYICGADDYMPVERTYWTDADGYLVGKRKSEPGQKRTIAPWKPPVHQSDVGELVLTGLLGPLGVFGVVGA